MKTGCFTICSRNYLAYALTLRDSLQKAEPDLDFRIFLADAPLDEAPPQGVEIIPVSEIDPAEMRDMAFRYTVIEFNTAVKPFCFDYMFDQAACDEVIYLDPDIHLFAPMQRVHEALAGGASCVLTPHILAPLPPEDTASEFDLMRSGTFNLGFATFANTPEARAFLTWWKNKLREHCRVDLQNGLFVDQRFVDFAPSFIEHLKVLRDPGYNVAYWNLANRPVRKTDTSLTAAGSPLVFFHFSGVSPGAPDVFSKHQSRFDMTNIGDAADLVRDYLGCLAANGQARWSAMPYAYGKFDTGEPIVAPMRQGPPADPAAPFAAPNYTYWNAPSERVDQTPGTPITRLMQAIHAARPDLQEAFPLSTAAGRRGFHAWFIAHGAREYRVGEAPLAAALSESAIQAQTIARHFARLRLGFAKAGNKGASQPSTRNS
jgi:hypothetical protein